MPPSFGIDDLNVFIASAQVAGFCEIDLDIVNQAHLVVKHGGVLLVNCRQ